MVLAFILLLAGATQEAPKPSTPTTLQQSAPSKTNPNQPEPAQAQKPKSTVPKDKSIGKAGRVRIVDSLGVPFVSVHAKKALRSEITAEMERQLKIPVVLGASLKQEQLTADFDDFPIEAAVKRLAPRPVIDYMIRGGGDASHPARKVPIAIYLLGPNDKAPLDGPWGANKASAQMVVGMVYGSDEEEKAALEKKQNELQVTYNEGLFTVKVYKQFLTDVLQEVAEQAHIPFAILTVNGSQKEIDQVVTWNMSGVNFEELTNTWFPNGVRLYWRTDLASDVSKPLRLTIEDREEAQAVQNVTP